MQGLGNIIVNNMKASLRVGQRVQRKSDCREGNVLRLDTPEPLVQWDDCTSDEVPVRDLEILD